MKKKIKKVVTPIVLASIIGMICGKSLFRIYDEKSSSILNSKIVYLLDDKSFDTLDSLKASTLSSSLLYYVDNGSYNKVIALTKEYDNISKIEKAYNKKLNVSKYLLDDEEINTKLSLFDNELKNCSDSKKILDITSKIIKLYKDRENVKMVKIS